MEVTWLQMILIFTTELPECAKLADQVMVIILISPVTCVVLVTIPLISSTELQELVNLAMPGICTMIYQEKDAQTVLVTNIGTVVVANVLVTKPGTKITKCVKVQKENLMTTSQREFLKLFLKLKLS